VTAAIVGARNAEQVEKNVGAVELQLTDEDVEEIEGVNAHQPTLITAA
jgi:aryl-alcohol dehydrogenase-like predicted oxidoreductase